MSEETMEREYWCHGCQKTVTCTEEVLCILCGSPFIEEVHYQRHFDVPSFLHESDMTQLTERLHMIYSMLREMRSLSFDIEEVGNMQDEEIDDIPTVERLQDQCAICLEAHEDVVRALPCNHTYHETCLRKWLKMKAICPTCKRPIRNPRLNAHFE